MNAITSSSHQPWSKENWSGRKSRSDCKISGPFGLRLQIAEETCDLALFDLAIDRNSTQSSPSQKAAMGHWS